MRFVTAGESHGPALIAVVSDVPAGVEVSEEKLNADLARRQGGYGRGGRQKIEKDRVTVLSGLRFGNTLGTPIALEVVNDDHVHWTDRMPPFGQRPDDLTRETHPRPGHADLVGMLKNDTDDARDILERSSARETTARVAAGGIAKAVLACFGCEVTSFVTRIGPVALPPDDSFLSPDFKPNVEAIEASTCRCPSEETTKLMEQAIDAAGIAGLSLGGEFTVAATGLTPGLGTFVSGPERLTSRLGAAVFSIPAIKGVEFGMGFDACKRPGSQVHDPIVYSTAAGYSRISNNAGGLEGGMTSGAPLIVHAGMKPIPTMRTPLATVDTDTHEPVEASKERSDVCAVPAAAVVAEAEVACVLADAYLDKFGHDTISDTLEAWRAYCARIASA